MIPKHHNESEEDYINRVARDDPNESSSAIDNSKEKESP